jgi:AcrR family transcriptional regulator
MSQTREAYHHGDLRNALISSAVRLIEQGGEAAFSLREAARDVGVSANAAYRHFDDKSALLTAAAADGLEQLARRMLKAMDRAAESGNKERPAIARFKAVGRAYVEFAMAHPELFRLIFGGSGVACLTADAAGGATPTPWELLGRSLDALVADGLLTADRREGAELKAWSVVHGFASLALAGHSAVPTGRQRHVALESALEFGVLGLCALKIPDRTSRSR